MFNFKTVTVAAPLSVRQGGGTWLGGINNAGEVVGWSYAATPTDSFPHAFTYVKGTAATITGPTDMRPNTTANDINNAGTVVGLNGIDPTGEFGYVRSSDGLVQFITSNPNHLSGIHDQAYGINDQGVVVGSSSGPGSHVGFVWRDGSMTPFSFPGATSTEVRGINNQNAMVGTANSYGFISNGPQVGLFGLGVKTEVNGINDNGTVVGSYNDGQHWHGFIDQDARLTFIDAPGAADTWVTGVNDQNTIVGYSDTALHGPTQGFIGTDGIRTMIRQTYEGLFNRDADPNAQTFWANLLETTPLTTRDFLWVLTTSPEGQWLHGGQTDAEFVDSVYNNSLGHPASSDALNAWDNILHSGAARWDVLYAISQSAEGEQHFAATHS